MQPNEIDEFHRWLGVCVSQWARVDDLLLAICWKALRTPLLELAAVVYYRQSGLQRQIDLADALLKTNLVGPAGPHADYLHWTAIRRRMRPMLDERNRMAHQPVTARLLADPPRIDVTIEQSFAKTLIAKDVEASLGQADLERHLIALQRLIADLEELYNQRLPAHLG